MDDDEIERRRELGRIFEVEIERRGWRKKDAYENFEISRAALRSVTTGAPTVSRWIYGKVSTVLQLPPDVWELFIAGNVKAIETTALDARWSGWTPTLKQAMVRALKADYVSSSKTRARQSGF